MKIKKKKTFLSGGAGLGGSGLGGGGRGSDQGLGWGR